MDPEARELFRRLGQAVQHGNLEKADSTIRALDRGWYFTDKDLDTHARRAVSAPAQTWERLRRRLVEKLRTHKNHDQRYALHERDRGEDLER